MEGDNEHVPFEWMVSRVCEEFGCLPSAAVREIKDDPNGTAMEIMRLRHYARTKELLDNAKTSADIPKGVDVSQVMEIQAEIMKGGVQDGEYS